MIDNGVGIQTEDIQKLFKMYGYLTKTEQLNSKGIGLGLYICKQISHKFGGSVGVTSEVGHGSKFTFSFMLDKKPEEEVILNRLLNPDSSDRKDPMTIEKKS